MIKAGDKYLDRFTWGDLEQFHCIEVGEKKFKLFDIVKVTLNDGRVITGEIGYIGEASFDILPVGENALALCYKVVEDIAF